MPYYMGDYAFRGDPGFFGFLKKAAGFIPGVGGLISKVIPGGASRAIEAQVMRPGVGGVIQRAGGAIMRLPTAVKVGGVLAGAAAVQKVMGPGGMLGPAGQAMKGFHISKRTGKTVRNRRMRVTNPRALRRAIRRAHGFARLARRVLHFTSPRAPRGRAIFKKQRRRAA